MPVVTLQRSADKRTHSSQAVRLLRAMFVLGTCGCVAVSSHEPHATPVLGGCKGARSCKGTRTYEAHPVPPGIDGVGPVRFRLTEDRHQAQRMAAHEYRVGEASGDLQHVSVVIIHRSPRIRTTSQRRRVHVLLRPQPRLKTDQGGRQGARLDHRFCLDQGHS